METDETTVAKLEQLLAAIEAGGDPRRASAEWKQVYRLLGATDLPPRRVAGVVGMRDPAGLRELIGLLRAPAGAGPDGEQPPDAEKLRRALRAFRKRVRLTRLDEESTLGRGPLSKGGGRSGAAIQPPAEWPAAVWEELVRQGRLRYIGHGLYELADGRGEA